MRSWILMGILGLSLNTSANEDFQVFLQKLSSKAREAGVSESTVTQAMAQAEYVPRAIKADRNQPEVKLTLDQYLPRAVPEWKIKQARQLYNDNRELLGQIEKDFGVQGRFVVALWGVESNFGRFMGNYNVVSALSTMAFEGRREEFFTKELINALKIIDNGDISVSDMKGSWAGAMGQVQFMPSSYLSYAVDQNQDGRRDIWTSTPDALASAANYLKQNGWQFDQTWGRQVLLPKDFDTSLLGFDNAKTLAQWQALGVRRLNTTALPTRDLTAALIAPDGPQGRVYLAYDNYRTLMRWNRSYYFVSAVGLLADQIIAQ